MPSDVQDRQMLHTAEPVPAPGAGSFHAMLQEVSVAVRDAGEQPSGDSADSPPCGGSPRRSVRPQFAGSWRRVDFAADKQASAVTGVLQSL
jgi:hypothetical protein